MCAADHIVHLGDVVAEINIVGIDPGRKVAAAGSTADGRAWTMSRGETSSLSFAPASRAKREAWAQKPAYHGGPTVLALQASLATTTSRSPRLGAVVAATRAALAVVTPLFAFYGSHRYLSLDLKVRPLFHGRPVARAHTPEALPRVP